MAQANEDPAADKYEILGVIGRGSFATVRKVRRKADNAILCRKEMNYLKMSTKERDQLHAELSILSSLKHPNIVKYYHREHHRHTQDLHIYMEYCGGGDLGAVIKKLKANNEYAKEEFVWRILSQLVTALYRCHHGTDAPEPGSDFHRAKEAKTGLKSKNAAMMILHRDLKPENVFLGDDQSVKLGDFGLSKLMQSHDFASTYVGTPYYMSPEICQAEKYTHHSDIWALGCIIYELCMKKPPFDAKTHLHLVQKIRKGEFEQLLPIYSRDLQNVIAHCLKTNPLQRPDAASLLSVPYVWIARKGKEMVELGRALQSKEEIAQQRLLQAEERLSSLDADKAAMQKEIETAVRLEWEVKARLEIDRQIQMALERLQKKFDKEVDEKVQMIISKPTRSMESRVLKDITNPPGGSVKENFNHHSSVNTTGDEDFPSTTDLTDLSDLSIHSPSTSTTKLPSKKAAKAPFVRSKTTFDSPADVHMSDPSPVSISSLALSPRRNAVAQAASEADSKNIFAEAARQRAKWEPTLAYTSDDDDDDIPDLPSPTRPKANPADPFKIPARPGLTRQNTTATMQKLNTQPTLFPTISNTAVAVRAATAPASAIPRTATEPDMRSAGLAKSPNRRLSKIPSSTSLALDAVGSPSRRANANLESKSGVQKNIQPGGRTLVELAQARAGGRPVSADVGKLGSQMPRFEPPVWDPERDEMPSPFLVRASKVVRGIR